MISATSKSSFHNEFAVPTAAISHRMMVLGGEPYSEMYGIDKGKPLDRYYMEQFLLKHEELIKGSVLEFGEDAYCKHFKVSDPYICYYKEKCQGEIELNEGQSSILHLDLNEKKLQVKELFDCILATNVICSCNEMQNSINNLYSLLKPGGTLLLTVPCITMQSKHDEELVRPKNIFTKRSLEYLFKGIGTEKEINSHGNLFIATSFLYGMTVEQVEERHLLQHDEAYSISISLKLVKEK